MIRGWIIFSSLVLSVLFKIFKDYTTGTIGFPFSRETTTAASHVYFITEHIIAIAIAACLLIHDETPRWLLKLFVVILIADFIHYLLFFRDPGIGFNLLKVIAFGLPLLWIHLKQRFNL